MSVFFKSNKLLKTKYNSLNTTVKISQKNLDTTQRIANLDVAIIAVIKFNFSELGDNCLPEFGRRSI